MTVKNAIACVLSHRTISEETNKLVNPAELTTLTCAFTIKKSFRPRDIGKRLHDPVGLGVVQLHMLQSLRRTIPITIRTTGGMRSQVFGASLDTYTYTVPTPIL